MRPYRRPARKHQRPLEQGFRMPAIRYNQIEVYVFRRRGGRMEFLALKRAADRRPRAAPATGARDDVNVLVLPSWYPHRCYPVEGLFLRDQALAIGELRPGWNVAIARWGQGRNFVSMAHARHSPRCMLEALL